MVLASNYDQSRFLKAVDLNGGEKKVRIKNCTEETMSDSKECKLVVWFTNIAQGLVLNKTNNRVLREAFGDETEGWSGKIIVLFSMPTELRGKMVQGLRVRIQPPKQAGTATKFMSRGQETKPLGNGGVATQPVKPAAKAVVDEVPDEDLDAELPAKPAAEPSLADELDDEIPWK
jgi:hypothetical protein